MTEGRSLIRVAVALLTACILAAAAFGQVGTMTLAPGAAPQAQAGRGGRGPAGPVVTSPEVMPEPIAAASRHAGHKPEGSPAFNSARHCGHTFIMTGALNLI